MAKKRKQEIDLVRSARNWMIGVSCISFLPALIILIITVVPDASPVIWDAVTFGMLGISALSTILGVLSAMLLHRGRKAGQMIGHIPASVICISFPLGTLTGIFTIIALNKKGIAKQLR